MNIKLLKTTLKANRKKDVKKHTTEKKFCVPRAGLDDVKTFLYAPKNADVGGKYLFVFDEQITGAFDAKGLPCEFVGSYKGLNGFSSEALNDTQIDRLIKKSFTPGASNTAFVYLINVLQTFAYMLLMWVLLSLALFAVSYFCKLEAGRHVFGAFTIMGSFFFVNGAISMIFAFIFSFVMTMSDAYFYTLLIYYIVYGVRCAEFIIEDLVRTKKAATVPVTPKPVSDDIHDKYHTAPEDLTPLCDIKKSREAEEAESGDCNDDGDSNESRDDVTKASGCAVRNATTQTDTAL